MSVDITELARECALKYLENAVYALNNDSPSYLWDLCPEAYAITEDDDALRDELWAAVCVELEEAQISYRLRGGSAREARLLRLRADADTAKARLAAAQRHYADVMRELGNAQEGGSDG